MSKDISQIHKEGMEEFDKKYRIDFIGERSIQIHPDTEEEILNNTRPNIKSHITTTTIAMLDGLIERLKSEKKDVYVTEDEIPVESYGYEVMHNNALQDQITYLQEQKNIINKES